MVLKKTSSLYFEASYNVLKVCQHALSSGASITVCLRQQLTWLDDSSRHVLEEDQNLDSNLIKFKMQIYQGVPCRYLTVCAAGAEW